LAISNDQIIDLLEIITAGTGRRFGEKDLVLWHAMLAPLDYDRCVAAVVRLLRSEPDAYIKPGHVWNLAKTTTDGDAARTVAPLALETGDVECPDCHCFHRPNEPHEGEDGSPLIPRQDVHRALPNLFRGPLALTSGEVAQHGAAEPVAGRPAVAEPTEEERAAEEAERARQLAGLAQLPDVVDAEVIEEATG
jgi:hypothetical protein